MSPSNIPPQPADPPTSPQEATASFQIELIISNLLRWGVAISLLLLGLGTLFAFLQGGSYGLNGGTAADYHRLLTHPNLDLLTLHGFLQMATQGHGEALIAPGLLLLIATPVLRVAISIFAFLLERDRTYALITATVLGLVLLSFALGKAG